MHNELLKKLSRIKIMIFDVDGVLTDGKMHYGENGEIMKSFYVQDGLGIQLLHRFGIQTAIISARLTPIVNSRAQTLGITHVIQGAMQKDIAFEQLLQKTGVSAHECGYIGDDIIDLPILTRAGVAFSVPNGHVEAQLHCDYITKKPGGAGAVREVCDLILKAQNHYQTIIESYKQ